MKILLDTNIIIDVISKRDGYEDSLQILRLCELKRLEGYVSAVTVTDIMYILRKHLSQAQLRASIGTLLTIVALVSVGKTDINRALASVMTDFEDAVQAACAKRINADYIVTRNLKDFEQSPVNAISPTELSNKFRN